MSQPEQLGEEEARENIKAWLKEEMRKKLNAEIERNCCKHCGGALFDGYIHQDGTIEGDPWCSICGKKPRDEMTE